MIARRISDFVVDRFFPGAPAASIDAQTPLISSGRVDSVGVLELITFLETAFGVELDAGDVERERLDTIEALTTLVRGKLGDGA